MQTALLIVIVIVVVVAWQVGRRAGQLNEREAARLLKEGAKMIDVRTHAEFAHDSIPGAVNVPLDALETRISQMEPDRSLPLLLHCHSGGRSGIGRLILRRAGYTRVHNLGSFGRARRIAEAARAEGWKG